MKMDGVSPVRYVVIGEKVRDSITVYSEPNSVFFLTVKLMLNGKQF